MDFNFEQMPRLCQIIKGVKITQGQKGRTPHSHLPITPRILHLMKGVWFPAKSKPSYDNLMLWAACHNVELSITDICCKYQLNMCIDGDSRCKNVRCPEKSIVGRFNLNRTGSCFSTKLASNWPKLLPAVELLLT